MINLLGMTAVEIALLTVLADVLLILDVLEIVLETVAVVAEMLTELGTVAEAAIMIVVHGSSLVAVGTADLETTTVVVPHALINLGSEMIVTIVIAGTIAAVGILVTVVVLGTAVTTMRNGAAMTGTTVVLLVIQIAGAKTGVQVDVVGPFQRLNEVAMITTAGNSPDLSLVAAEERDHSIRRHHRRLSGRRLPPKLVRRRSHAEGSGL